MATATGFVALDQPLGFGAGILGTPQPKVSPVMRELVRRGVAAVPALLDHLSDARRTKLILKQPFNDFGGTWFGDEYDPRDEQIPDLPKGLNRAGKSFTENSDAAPSDVPLVEDHDKDGYHVKVGDFCFVTLGQIVNRQLAVARYQPTACLVLSSPVRNPTLAAAARADWNKLTETDFKAFLTRDITDPAENVSQIGALQRMLFYYPADGQRLAMTLLAQPMYSDNLVADVLIKLADAGEPEQDKLLTDFRTRHGEEPYQAVVQRLVSWSLEPPLDPAFIKDLPDEPRRRVAVEKLVGRRFAEVDKHPPVIRQSVYCQGQESLVDALADFPSPVLDRGIYDLLRRVLVLPTDGASDKLTQCELAAACAKRFATLARRDALDEVIARLRRRKPSDQAAAKVSQTYSHDCDKFLHALAADPLIQPPATHP